MKKDKLRRYRVDGPAKIRLQDIDPAARPCSVGRGPDAKEADRAYLAALARRLAEAQDRFYALRQDKVLIVLQGMDTAGKDGTIRAVFQAVDPLGVRAVSYRTPTQPEADRDFLWRHHRDVPGKGEVVIFNRSHYEAVLIEYVHDWIDKAERKRRFEHIRTLERLLADTGTTIVKCFLHISAEEQRRRLQDRIDDPNKHWKFNPNDIEERKLWDRYQRAYEAVVENTSTRFAPWYIVPSDSKSHRNLMVSEILLATLEPLAPGYPKPNQAYTGWVVT
jgi:PPK2 family polyphosphate:nucleotide phosphotransferase